MSLPNDLKTTISQTVNISPLSNEEPDERYSSTLTKEEFLRDFFSQKARIAIVELTPMQAQWLLETSPGNRNLISSNLKRIQNDMEAGRFTLSNDNALFDTEYRLRNAHHRLFCQVVTQKTLLHTIRRWVTENELVNMDRGVIRNGDAQMGFIPEFREKYGKTDHNEARIISSLVTQGGYTNRVLSPTETAEGILYFKDDLQFIINTIENSAGKKRIKGLTHATSLSVVLRILHTSKQTEKEDKKEKIKYALEYLADGGLKVQNGQTTRLPGTDSLFALNRFYSNISSTSGSVASRKIYLTTENMLNYFLKGEEKNNATAAGGKSKTNIELFPISNLPFVQKESAHEILMNLIGRNVFAALVSWGKSAENGRSYKPIEIAKELCKEKFLTVGKSPPSDKTVAGRLGRAMKEFDSISFPGGCLTPTRKGKKIDYYDFEKSE